MLSRLDTRRHSVISSFKYSRHSVLLVRRHSVISSFKYSRHSVLLVREEGRERAVRKLVWERRGEGGGESGGLSVVGSVLPQRESERSSLE